MTGIYGLSTGSRLTVRSTTAFLYRSKNNISFLVDFVYCDAKAVCPNKYDVFFVYIFVLTEGLIETIHFVFPEKDFQIAVITCTSILTKNTGITATLLVKNGKYERH
mmetsp:Transcript_14048/g.28031  ORF Transcript_14048/g.28031 Transcript_14048/m.28031 type:complete len:107 (-) Transcript_14048:97-417(-)